MGQLSRDIVKKSVLAAGMKWFDDKPMIVSIRTTVDVPDMFNDFITLSMPNGYFVALPGTTDPGLFGMYNPSRKSGVAIVKEGQWIDSHVLGYHGSGLRRQRAWQQCGKMQVYRDGNKDAVLDRDVKTLEWTDAANGLNIHSCVVLDKVSNLPLMSWVAPKVWNWSEGCQVAAKYGDFKTKMTDVCDKWEKDNKKVGIKYTLTILLEKQLIF